MPRSANPLSFPQSQLPLSPNAFQNPSAEYRGAPLWCWNTRLKEDQLLRQIDQLSEMGMGGFHIHSRVGLDTPYLGSEFMDLVKACVDRAREKNMLACLYDEDRWPSGAAGGLVVQGHPEFQAQHLLFTPWPYGSDPDLSERVGGANGKASRSELGQLVGRYNVVLKGGLLSSFKRLSDNEISGKSTWYAYVEPNLPSEWFNGETYVDTLNKAAIERFIETTHDVYYEKLADDFGKVVPSIFTDEPQFAHKTQLHQGSSLSNVFLPWSLGLEEDFKAEKGYDLLDFLPELVWDAVEPSVVARYHFHDYICERFVSSFMDTVASWTQKRGIYLIGHMMKEPTLLSQTQALGEAMRCYRNLDMPGIDLLCDGFEFNTAKQATSVARQNGTKGIMSEIYGVTNWTFDFAGHKVSGDWQAALGVVFRVHHLSWVSMAGEAKRDYPAAIGYQSPWYKEYSYIEDYFARMTTVMTRGSAKVSVGVIHPIESFWIDYGPKETTGQQQTFRDQAFEDLSNWLLHGLIDFDFISESLFPSQTSLESISEGKPLSVGECRYDVIIVPNLRTIRSTTLERLRMFSRCGGTVIVAGDAPTLVDAKQPHDLPCINGSLQVPWTSFHILNALRPWRDLAIWTTDERKEPLTFLYQMRQDGEDEYIFICNTDRKRWYPTETRIRGEWTVSVLDALSGDEWILESTLDGGWTAFEWHFEPCSSLLVRLSPIVTAEEIGRSKKQLILRNSYKTTGEVQLNSIVPSEPNVLVLDYAQFSISGGPWQDKEEVLRIDNIVRRHLNIPQKLEAFRQPWSLSEDSRRPIATLTLRFEVTSKTDIDHTKLALEDAASVQVTVNGTKVTSKPSAWWVDECIGTLDLPRISAGITTIEITYDFGHLTNIERVYLLGAFEVDVRATKCTLVPQNLTDLTFGDWTRQGYPFYAGNMTYRCALTGPSDLAAASVRTILEVPRFAGPVVTVDVDGDRAGTIALQPHMLDLGVLSPGRTYEVDITCYGNRENAFGTLHLPDGCTKWFAPNAWRSEHDWWQAEYNVKPMGLLQRPRIKGPGTEKYFVNRNPERLWCI